MEKLIDSSGSSQSPADQFGNSFDDVTTVTSQHSTFNRSRRVSSSASISLNNKNSNQVHLKTPAGNVLGSNTNKNLLASMNKNIATNNNNKHIIKTDMATSPIKQLELLDMSSLS